MEQQSSTSKVTVEYFDPHDVYKLIAPGLVPRLPLRNLHWQSHAGPLRSIDTLHVDLVQGGNAERRQSQASSKTRRSRSASRDDGFQTQQVGGQVVATELDEKHDSASKQTTGGQRRHQIPGLRSTPYLKVLLVRCDDNESYKSSARAEIREWIKAHTPPSSTSKKASKQEKHDAFEWLILHVVIPNTTAATQPRSSAVKAEAGASDKSSTGSRWRTGSTPLMEKLRSDFNSSSKGSPDRIAQIRIGINDVPYDLLPRVIPAVPSGYSETEQDTEQAWNELISKLKHLILSSFDMRVMQYEDDIKEKDAQRNLPGWNFCTFFILKEGLARGFENVGLVEDALVSYDELSVGLDTVIREQAKAENAAKHGSSMLAYTEDLKHLAKNALAELSGELGDGTEDLQKKETPKADTDDIPITSSQKAYRDMILANQVSVFDFRCYIFSRQIALLFRLGNVSTTREELLAKLKEQQRSTHHGVAPLTPPTNNDSDDELENLSMLSEVCRRALEFIPSISQIMFQDISTSLLEDANTEKAGDSRQAFLDPSVSDTVDNVVSSFAFAVAQQILAQTSTKALPIPSTTLSYGDGVEQKSSIPEPKTMMHPSRTTSLPVQTMPQTPLSPAFPGPGRQLSLQGQESHTSTFLKVGLEELAARRAELYMLSRSILDGLGKKRGWSNGWDEAPLIGRLGVEGMEEISLHDEEEDNGNAAEKQTVIATSSLVGIGSGILSAATDNAVNFYRLYEIMTLKANQHFTVADHTHAVLACLADLAMLKFHMKEYEAAAKLFWDSTPSFGEEGWSLVELSTLAVYCKCLSEIEANDKYVTAALTLLTKFCAAKKDMQQQKPGSNMAAQSFDLIDTSPIKAVADKLLALSRKGSSQLPVPLTNFFMDVELEGPPEYLDQKDSCSLVISLKSLVPTEIMLDSAKLRITCIDGGPCRDITFEADREIVIVPGKNILTVKSNSVVPGSYRVSHMVLLSSTLLLHHDHNINHPPPKTSDIFRQPDVVLFQRIHALNVQLTASKHISLGKNNALDLVVYSGWNSLKTCEVRIRPTTGGLRLLTTEAQLEGDHNSFAKQPESGAIFLGPVEANKTATVRFPYSTEQDLGDVSIRVEVNYVTQTGESFYFAKSIAIPVSLAVGVNVQDVFKHNALFSRFNVETATSSPLRIFKSELQESELFESSFGCSLANTVMVFPKQHATLLYKVTRKPKVKASSHAGAIMHLKLDYSVLQTEIEDLIQQSIIEGLKNSPLELYSMVTAACVSAETRKGLQAHDLERAGLVGEVTTAYLEGVPWAHNLRGLGCVPGTKDDAAMKLAAFLEDWQKTHPHMKLPTSAPEVPSSMVIPVEIPSLSVVHSADIRIDHSILDQLAGPAAGAPVACVNQIIPATLNLKWTRIWDTGDIAREDDEFSYEVTAPVDTWLLGGRRRGHYVIPGDKSQVAGTMSSTTGTEAKIPLVLIPQREGYLPYPTVEIKEVPKTGGSSRSPASFEVDSRNLGETVRVVSERMSVTVSLDASGPGGGPLVFESEVMRRQKGRTVA